MGDITKNETVFQKIIRKEVSGEHIVYETEDVLAFLDANPVNKGHTLVIPKEPIRDIHGLTDSLSGEGTILENLMRAIVIVSNAVKEATGAPGINVISNNGQAARQSVPHLHFHIVPRFKKSEYRNPTHVMYDDYDDRAAVAQSIMDAIKHLS